jgi:uncharacterized membrane protein
VPAIPIAVLAAPTVVDAVIGILATLAIIGIATIPNTANLPETNTNNSDNSQKDIDQVSNNVKVKAQSVSSSASQESNNENTNSDADNHTTANGQRTDEYGNKIGPSGKPQVNVVRHPTEKGAKDAARAEGKSSPVKHTNPAQGKDHYHATDSQGEKIHGSAHHEY